jgi:Porin subfamily
MKQAFKVGRIVTFATFAAVGALLCGLSTANAQSTSAPGAGAFPGSLLVPGTNTSLKIGGYAKVDYMYDMSTNQNFVANGGGTAANVSIIPLNDNIPGSTPGAGHSIHGDSHISAAESRFNIETRTPTSYGELKTFIEGDFEGISGVTPSNTFELNSDRTAFALRHAYGTLGPLLAGQYFSLFEDISAVVETLDFGGAIGVSGPLRQAQFRYVYNVGNGVTLAASIENPQTAVVSSTVLNTNVTGTSTFALGQGDKIPDFVGAVIFGQGPGHIAFRAVGRELYDVGPGVTNTAGLNTPGTNAKTLGWGAGISGDLHVFGPDDIIVQANGGKGIGRYITNTGTGMADSVISADGHTLTAIWQWGGVVGYQHWWVPSVLRSNIEGSILEASYPNGQFTAVGDALPTGALGGLNHRLISSHLNLIWSPVPPVDLGVEGIWEQRRTVAGQNGQLERMQVSAKFKF